MSIDASRWTPCQIRRWRVLNPGKDPDQYLYLGNPHTPLGGLRWDAAFRPFVP